MQKILHHYYERIFFLKCRYENHEETRDTEVHLCCGDSASRINLSEFFLMQKNSSDTAFSSWPSSWMCTLLYYNMVLVKATNKYTRLVIIF